MTNKNGIERSVHTAQGLYDPRFEHDACGVGLVADIKNKKSHDVVRDGIRILVNLTHRGACGCDETTGDGAGLLMQTPHRFLSKAAGDVGIRIPEEGHYACGMVFLPPDALQRRQVMALLEEITRKEGQRFLGWRKVPTASEALGALARAQEPSIFQFFVGRNGDPGAGFERKLYVIRKRAEKAVRESELPEKGFFHVASLSAKTLVYKGMLLADQIDPFFPDLSDPDMESAMVLVHQRYSTNTFPKWELAQPFRFLCHNGEINTLSGNVKWLEARQHLFGSDLFGNDIAALFPVATAGASDSAILDNTLELLHLSGRSLAHAMMMLIPEAWQNHRTMSDRKKAFYEFHSCMMEPWDGPAAIAFSDGRFVGATLDRNGLRPSRYTVTTDGRVIMASETGVLEIPPEKVRSRGRLRPGRMFLVDLQQGRIVEDEEIKEQVAARKPYRKWLSENLVPLSSLKAPEGPCCLNALSLRCRQQIFGYTLEELRMILSPMAAEGKEPLGSMGDDIPAAILSKRPRLLFDYFKQLFAQVTNPPLDAIREELVTSLVTPLGAERNLFEETPAHCKQLRLDRPILNPAEFSALRSRGQVFMGDATFAADGGGEALEKALQGLFSRAAEAVATGAEIVILSDRKVDETRAPIPSLLAVSGLHHHLIQKGLRPLCGIVAETGEAREVHHFCCLLGYGAGAVYPYLAFETLEEMIRTGVIPDVDMHEAESRYIEAADKGILKVISKMGISTLHSYRGAQIFECVGLHSEFIDTYFTGTASRIGGAGLSVLAEETGLRHRHALAAGNEGHLEVGGKYKWRRGGESHQWDPLTIARLQQAVRSGDRTAWDEYTQRVLRKNREEGTLRGLLELKPSGVPVPLESVEPWTEIVKRFKTGAMSYGSISKEAHETLAVAMNRIGGKSNSGEGGEDADRFTPDENGNWRNSAIKQVASGRFGVTAAYLANAADLQIKMAQGAKPGEGGQLPAYKVYPWIAKTRHSTPYVGLISPPPHHDIYSIEDLAQLIYDLKNANPEARINVKLVSEVGVGTVAAGVVKAKADLVLISGESGGTGASPQTSIRHAGLPWELGLAETHQTLVLSGLRSRIVVECDGQLKTGRDIAVACLLGAEEFGFGTAALVALGCVMMRVCHLNTCPVGIATQDPELRKKFAGKPEHLIRFMQFVAEDFRRIMAGLGFCSVSEMVGRVDRLETAGALDHWKAQGLDFSKILHRPEAPPEIGQSCATVRQDHGLEKALDHRLIQQCRPALEHGEHIEVDLEIRNVQRTVGTLLSYHITQKYGEEGLAADTIVVRAMGTAGQSFCAFGARGLTFHVLGEANDYFGKGLSGAKLTIRPREDSPFKPHENILIGNVALYGATSGEAYIRGAAGERFCVRNSGVLAVVEGVGDHGCEYMTGGRVAVLGATGRNFAAGMSGGIAYVLDEAGDFGGYRCNREMVELEKVQDPDEVQWLRSLIETHARYTESDRARQILDSWNVFLPLFVKVMPVEYKEALARLKA